jgi:hypothetical protein
MEGNNVEDNQDVQLPEEDLPENLDAFSYKRLRQLHIDVNNQWAKGETDIQVFTELYFEWTKFFSHMGRALVVAFKGK